MRSLRIGLVWHAAAATNLGVGALTAGNLALARKAAAAADVVPQFVIIGPRETGPLGVSGPDIEHRTITGRYMVNPSGFARDVRGLDIILDISAGDSFADIYPDKRFAYMAATKILPILMGKPLVLSPQTIGPFSRQPHSAIAGWICRHAAAVFARDPLSMQMLATLGATANARQTVDVAFALPFERAARTAGGPRRVGINVSGLLMSGGYAGGNEYGLGFDYPALTHGLITALLAAPDTEVHLVPHVIAPGLPRDDDGAAADALKAQYPALHRHPNFASASAAKSFISGLDFLAGARMHATIAAYSAGVPVVPISYSRKFEGLYGGLGYPWLVNARGMSTDAALAFILNAVDRRAELAADIAAGSNIVADGLDDYVAALAELFAAAAQ
ncbi:polysaccharide pyruvyl transferase family protein [Sandarakinorhabdus sp.]|uniref:polysaccharide pyruvyl transferase family protein n=1 Tax=Sandarakinorhabdus sp. TaxID=1916663 RepID=UPI00286D6C0A|nr:polysaccharide pyruvyl transferase family protein [Sandarakinorhabdus sp.]